MKTKFSFPLTRAALFIYFLFFWMTVSNVGPELIDSRHVYLLFTIAVAGFLGALLLPPLRTFGLGSLITAVALVTIVQLNGLMKEIHFEYLIFILLFFILYLWNLKVKNPLVTRVLPHLPLILMATSYTSSGLSKVFFAPWNDGTMLMSFYQIGFLRWDLAKSGPSIYQALSLLVGFVETLSAPLLLYRRTFSYGFVALTAMQIGILIFARLEHISIAMLIFHLFVYESRAANVE